jgi:hypothetical protein
MEYYKIVPTNHIGENSEKMFFFRNEMTLKFNEYLSEQCKINEVLYVDVTKEMLLTDGSTDAKFIMNDIHLSQEITPILIEKFKSVING